LYGREIQRAVLGELTPAREERLRAHLRGCEACRARYDALSATAKGIGGGARAEGRERDRLLAALDGPAAGPAVSGARARRRWLAVGLALAPVAAVVIWLARPGPVAVVGPGAGEVTMRGGAETSTPAPLTMIVYASRKTGPASHGPVRLIGELPGSGEAYVSMGDYLQLGLRGLRAPAHVRVVGVYERGGVHEYVHDTPVAPGAAVTVGGSIDLAQFRAHGHVKVVAAFSERAVTDEVLKEAIAGKAGPGVTVLRGLLVIE
jgi:hypothetical protein